MKKKVDVYQELEVDSVRAHSRSISQDPASLERLLHAAVHDLQCLEAC